MSTRCTIAYDQNDFHLYQECFENDNVYLQLDGGGWAASLDTANVDWREDTGSRPKLGLRIDVTLWRKIVEGWLVSQWANDPSRDHKKDEWDPEAFNAWVESIKLKKEEKNNE
jgi:hypothetical protein